ncbi:hypothetical protein [Deinococcus radiodurans]|jgi:hypothetical protein|uniref:Uncharacterized protein n=1 Tax=Deinococcus radiodurans (strain ATCC 13939 / DSM 20539 / JCM 16871 / CCUG 27074 / LMG 4051 / NBRC 15346 / NCIMB 9279 / VKM B-1422 / R1) TaxID=243230 RepID=Q9RWZ2_DEIRA|nr:hypothetical protein [Deinococcus radiodurans]AAF10103.1 hypothetical protein DR_0523 [Deinococcus radiodurans R1 = ATCC 13939 = DSM 20539]ANC72233.1 hypothetical protein A2G07_10900 [Deinococcus radiodurans R1 = ATCC 13939 = DSM 20539]QEM72472.1 hypothetical protein DXG80_12300 [Deinococcus radiodurans]QIP28701.1 hypothetical protein HAV23_05510 [Deinococcus radiodurans]QIP32596.1 hypothetical protein HAV35_11300 [Deinococcus radiodurans]
MTEPNTAARTPAALAEHLGLSVPQLAQQLARVTQTEGLSAQGLTVYEGAASLGLSAAEVLGVLAMCPGTAEREAAPLLDFPASLNGANMPAALCDALSGVYAVLSDAPPQGVSREHLGRALAEVTGAAQVLAQLDGTPAALSAAQVMTARALAAGAGAELYPADTLAQFRAAGERRAAEHRHPVTGQPLAGGRF